MGEEQKNCKINNKNVISCKRPQLTESQYVPLHIRKREMSLQFYG